MFFATQSVVEYINKVLIKLTNLNRDLQKIIDVWKPITGLKELQDLARRLNSFFKHSISSERFKIWKIFEIF